MKASHLHPAKHGASWRTKSQVQALGRSQPAFPMMPGMPEKRTHDYVGNGTASVAIHLGASGLVPTHAGPQHRCSD